MKPVQPSKPHARLSASRIGIAVAALLCLGLLAASPALGAYEQVGNFAGTPGVLKSLGGGVWPEEVQFGGLGGMAVNYTGAGGVPAGTIYSVRSGNTGDSRALVSRYNPDGSFSERWTFDGSSAPDERCGPEGDPSQPTCTSIPSGSTSGVDIDVDETNGYVYVYDLNSVGGEKVIHVYTADGSEVKSAFGERSDQPLATDPEKLHFNGLFTNGAIAVNGSGDVYVFDNASDGHRLMVFEPQSPGDYEHYVYAGQSHDLDAGLGGPVPQFPAVDAEGYIYAADANNGRFVKLDPSQPKAPPLCEFSFPKGAVESLAVNPLGGELFFFSEKERSTLHELAPGCEKTGHFTERSSFSYSPKRISMSGLAFDPLHSYASGRPAGILYAGSSNGEGGKQEEFSVESALGYVFARPAAIAPLVESNSFFHVTTTSAALAAQVNPKGSATRYVFQYLPESQYQENEPDERQSLTISATGGVFGLAFEGKRLGGEATANLTSGSKEITALRIASGKADLSAAKGTGDLNGAVGKGTVSAGLTKIIGAEATSGSFEVGQGIGGEGIPFGSTITAVAAEGALQRLTISQPATKSALETKLTAGSTQVTGVSTSEGTFEVGQTIEGSGIAGGTKIVSVGAGELTLSGPVPEPSAAVALKAGATTLKSLVTELGSFEAGQAIEGEGIPSGTSIVSAGAGTLQISKPLTKPGSGVSVHSPGPYPLAVGEQVEGTGIPAGTTIASIQAGKATLSAAATTSGTVSLRAGVSATARAKQLREALEGLATIGEGNVAVSGGPGDEAGSSPYEVTFKGKFENEDVPELEADDSNLSGGAATAEVQTENEGGQGFSTGAIEAPAGGASAGEGAEGVSVATTLEGLDSDSAYRVRVVAVSQCWAGEPEKTCEGTGAPLALHTLPVEAPGLPDGRAYELVSPPQKGGGQVVPAEPRITTCGECKPGYFYDFFPRQSTPAGDAIVYESTPFGSEESSLFENELIARRDPSTGWQSTNLTPTLLAMGSGSRGESVYSAFATGLGSGVLKRVGPTLGPEAPDGYKNLYAQSTASPFGLTPLLGAEQSFHRSASEFEIEYAGASADHSRIFFSANDALTEETEATPEAVDGGKTKNNLYEWHDGQISLVNVMPGNSETHPGASFGEATAYPVSEDGRRVFFSDASGQVYVRINGEETQEIETEGMPDPGKFLVAATDGSAVLLANGHLHQVGGGEATVDLTEGKGGFQGVVGESEDLSHVYFVDTAVLDETPNEVGDEAKAGAFNLYAWQQGQSARFVAWLRPGDNDETNLATNGTDWQGAGGRRSAEASPQGRYLAFMSEGPLTGKESIGGTCHGPCQEAFLYDSASGKLVCASCNPGGQSPLGQSILRRTAKQSLGQRGPAIGRPRYLSDEGRLFFDSRDSLVAADTNEGAEDVYEWEPNGVGDCKSVSNQGGCVALISAGTGLEDSNFLAADPDSKDVFFTTRDQLTLKDRDNLIDLYDAREGGGIPAETEVARAECQGEACQAPVNAPNHPTPATSAPAGEGNAEAPHKQKKAKKPHKKHKRHAKQRGHKNRAAKRHQGGRK